MLIYTQLLTKITTYKFPSLAVGEGPDEQVAAQHHVEDAGHEQLDQLGRVDNFAAEAFAKDLLKRKFMSCSHGQELGQLAVLASDWLFTLVQPIMSQLAC